MSQLLSAPDTYVPRAGEHGQTPVQRVHGRHSTGSSRVGTRPNALMDMRTDLTAVPHAGLGYHFLRVQVRTTGASGSSNGEGAKISRSRAANRSK